MADAKRKLLIEILSDGSQVSKGFKQAESSTKTLGSEFDKFGDKLDVSLPKAAAVAGTAIVAFGVASIASFQKQSQEVVHFQQVTGLAAEEASRFVAVADDFGVAASDLSTEMARMNKVVATAPQNIESLGIAIAKTSTGAYDSQKTFLNVVDAFNETDDASRRAAIGSAVFGKNWQSMTKLLDQGSANIKAAFAAVGEEQIFKDEDLKKSEAFRHSLDDMGDAFRGLQRDLGEGLVPAVVWAMKQMQDFIGGIREATARLKELAGPLVAIYDAVVKTWGAIKDFVPFLDDGAEATSRLNREYIGVAKNINDMRIKQEDLNQQVGMYVLPALKGTAMTKQMAEATKDLTKAYSDGAGQAEAIAEANKRVGAALEEQRKKVEDATKALQDYRQATNDLRNDQLGLEGSIYSALDAIDAYTVKVTDSTATLREQQQANLDVKKSLEEVMQQALDAATSQAALHGATLTANGAIAAQLSALQLLYQDGMLPELRKEIDEYAAALYNVPGQIHTDIDYTGTDPITGRAIGGSRREGTGAGGSAAVGAQNVSDIKAYESSNGKSWRS